MRVLYLAHRFPFPPNKGEKIRAYHQIRGLAARHEIWLATFEDPEVSHDQLSGLDELCREVNVVSLGKGARLVRGARSLFLEGRSLTEGYFYSPELARVVVDWIARYEFDVAFVFSSSMAPYVVGKCSLPTVVDFVDQDSRKWSQYAKDRRFPFRQLYRLESRRLLAYELELLREADRSIAITEEEASLFKEAAPRAHIEVVGNGVDCDHYSYSPAPQESRDLVFTGRMDYYPNEQGVVEFAREAFPRIREAVPDTRFFVVGAAPTARVRDLHDGESIVVTGRVPETVPYLHRAAVAVVPLSIGRGLQNKVLEALASGAAVVTTESGYLGVGGEPGTDLIVASAGEDFVAAVIGLLQDPVRRLRMAESGRRHVESRFGWERRTEDLEGILAEVASRG